MNLLVPVVANLIRTLASISLKITSWKVMLKSPLLTNGMMFEFPPVM